MDARIATNRIPTQLTLRVLLVFVCVTGAITGLLLRRWNTPVYLIHSTGTGHTVYYVTRNSHDTVRLALFCIITRQAVYARGSQDPRETSEFSSAYRKRLGLYPRDDGAFDAFVVSADGKHFPIPISRSEAARLCELTFYPPMSQTELFQQKIAPVIARAERHEAALLGDGDPAPGKR